MRPEDVAHILIHLDNLYRFAFVILGKRASAEDAVRSVYAHVRDELRAPPSFSEPANWYFSILVKEIRVRRRLAWKLDESLQRFLHRVGVHWGSSGTTDADLETRRTIDQLRLLPVDEAAAILLHDVFDFAPAVSCEILGVSNASFYEVLSNARARLLRVPSPSRSSKTKGLPCQATARTKVETA